MADTKISALPSGAPALAGDEYVIARSGANYKLTGTNLLGLVTSTANTFTADQTFGVANATTLDATNVEVTNLKAKDGTAAATIANSTGVISVSTKVEYADGTAAAPTVTNTGDTDTGVYFPAANEVAVTTGGTVAAGFNSNGLFFRNRIINGDMRIDQRNAGASVSLGPLSGVPTYITDRWKVYQFVDGVFAWQQVSDAPTGFVNSLKCTVTTASPTNNNEANLDQPIEGLNVADLAWGTANARPVTLSFWIKSSLTGQMGGSLSNSANNRSYPWAVTISSANTWEYKTITIPGDTSGTWLTTNGVGIRVYFDLGCYSGALGPANAWAAANYKGATGDVRVMSTLNATWYITGVQLETGSVATPFERRPYGTELMLCQRYYYRATTGTLFNQLAFCNIRTTTSHYAFMQLPVLMRANPTSVTYNNVGIIASWGAGVTGLNSLTFADATYGTGQTQVLLDAVTSGAVGTAGNISMLIGNNDAAGYVALSAEL